MKIEILNNNSETSINSCVDIARELKEWFTKDAIKNMKIDFKINQTLIIIEKKDIMGFLNFNSDNGILKIIWLGVKKEFHRKGFGNLLFKEIFKLAKKLKIKDIEVETLSPEYDYVPYESTRMFYYKMGFKDYEIKKNKIKGGDNLLVLRKELVE